MRQITVEEFSSLKPGEHITYLSLDARHIQAVCQVTGLPLGDYVALEVEHSESKYLKDYDTAKPLQAHYLQLFK